MTTSPKPFTPFHPVSVVNPSAGLTILLLLLMAGTGVASTSWGYNLGREALKGIVQPDFRPTADSSGRGGKRPEPAPLKLIDESQLIAKTKAATQTPATGNKPPEPVDPAVTQAQPQASPLSRKAVAKLPLSATDKGVTLTVVGASRVGDSLVFEVTLRNKGDRPVQFLYSFLEMADDQGDPISAIVEDLPSDLPSDGATVRGKAIVPAVLLEGVKSLQLSLTDYPDRQLQLQVVGIPVR
jgi:hypothetical protein